MPRTVRIAFLALLGIAVLSLILVASSFAAVVKLEDILEGLPEKQRWELESILVYTRTSLYAGIVMALSALLLPLIRRGRLRWLVLTGLGFLTAYMGAVMSSESGHVSAAGTADPAGINAIEAKLLHPGKIAIQFSTEIGIMALLVLALLMLVLEPSRVYFYEKTHPVRRDFA
ncbi:hypothetical protein [Longispora albida]|uniref:hypothetical protein n=1 Tax=Longispora albida TaxID=203523 RepID=UPI0003619346|nr:hypothetical protein [Longispora albida]